MLTIEAFPASQKNAPSDRILIRSTHHNATLWAPKLQAFGGASATTSKGRLAWGRVERMKCLQTLPPSTPPIVDQLETSQPPVIFRHLRACLKCPLCRDGRKEEAGVDARVAVYFCILRHVLTLTAFTLLGREDLTFWD